MADRFEDLVRQLADPVCYDRPCMDVIRHVCPHGGDIYSQMIDFRVCDLYAKLSVNVLCDFICGCVFCFALTKAGRDDLAYDLLLNEEYPGWLYEVNLGATTIWERWNSLDATGHISSTGMNSLNHYSYGAIVQWMFERCAGLKALEPGFRKVRIAPLPHAALNHLEMEYASAAGPWRISWQSVERKHLQLSVQVPFGAEAEVILPLWNGEKEEGNPLFADVRDGICHLSAGTYSAVYTLNEPIMGIL